MVLQRYAAIGAAATLMVFAACGGDGSSRSTTLELEATDQSREQATLTASTDTVAAGVVTITLRNEGDAPHDAQLFRIEGDRDGADVANQILENIDGATQPGWASVAGGVAQVAPDESATVTQVLTPGRYVVADTQERDDTDSDVTGAARGATAEFEVVGEVSGRLPSTPAEVELTDTHIFGRGLHPGINRVTVMNTGSKPHLLAVFPPGPGEKATGPPVETIVESGLAWVPVDLPSTRSTTSLAPGEAQVTELRFRDGMSLLACLAFDWSGGIMHGEAGHFNWTRTE